MTTAALDLFLPICDPAVEAIHAMTAHYTRDLVVEQVLDLIEWPSGTGKLLEPGCGDGQFLIQAIARLPLAIDDAEALTSRVEAWELHPAASSAARDRLTQHLIGRGWTAQVASDAAQLVVVHNDFLAPGPQDARFDFVAGNPPYARMATVPMSLQDRYRPVVPVYAWSDLLHAFLDRCVQLLTPTGQLAMVSSDRWLFNQTTSTLREEIGRNFGIRHLSRLDSSSAFYRPKTRRAGSPARVHPVAVSLVPKAAATQALTRLPIYPGAPLHAAQGTLPLGDCALVKLAPWMGPHGCFTIDMAEARAKGLPESMLVPCVDTDDAAGGLLQAPTRFAIRTQRDITPPLTVLAHFEATIDRIPLSKRRTPMWMPPEGFGSFPWETEAVMIPRIAKGIRPIRLPAGILPINHNLTVMCHAAGTDALIAALTTDEVQEWIDIHAPRLENGYRSITTNLLRRMPVRLAASLASTSLSTPVAFRLDVVAA